MPRVFTFESTGAITNMLRNSDSPASTWFGGTLESPSALRVSDSTTKIFVKLVTNSSRDGATPRIVISSRMLTDWLGFVPTCTDTVGSVESVDGPLGALGAAGPSGALTAAPDVLLGPTGAAFARADPVQSPHKSTIAASSTAAAGPRARPRRGAAAQDSAIGAQLLRFDRSRSEATVCRQVCSDSAEPLSAERPTCDGGSPAASGGA